MDYKIIFVEQCFFPLCIMSYFVLMRLQKPNIAINMTSIKHDLPEKFLSDKLTNLFNFKKLILLFSP